MAQHPLILADSDGATFLAALNAALAAVKSTHSGSARPPNAAAQQLWVDTNSPSATEWTLFMFDGADDIEVGTVDAMANRFTFAGSAIGRQLQWAGSQANARAAIGAAAAAAGLPVGMVALFPGATPPPGWIKRNGALLSRTTFAELWAYAQSSGALVSDATWLANPAEQGKFSAGDGSTTFRVGDDRGNFLRAWDDGRGVDGGRGIGTWQADEVRSHVHHGTTSGNGAHSHGNVPMFGGDSDRGNMTSGFSVDNWGQTDVQGWHDHVFTTAATGGAETRPRNTAFLSCIFVGA